MKALALVLVVVVSGCASAAPPSQPSPLDDLMHGTADTTRPQTTCADARGGVWAVAACAALDAWNTVQPAIDAMGKMK